MANAPQKQKEADAPEAAAEAPAATGSKKKKIIIILMVLILLGVAGGAAAYFLGQKNTTGKDEKKVEKAIPTVFLPLDNFVVNLQSENGDKYLSTNITLQVKNEEQINYYKSNMPQLRSRVIMLLSSKSSDELLTNEGKEKLMADIIKKVQQPYGGAHETPEEADEHKVLGVNFTSFMIQ